VNLFRLNINVSAFRAKMKLTLFTNMILHNIYLQVNNIYISMHHSELFSMFI